MAEMKTIVNFEEDMRLGKAHHQAGRLDQAEPAYRKVLKAEPGHAEANHLLGLIAYQRGQHDEAVRLISRAIEVVAANSPRLPVFYCNLGNALKDLGRLDDAVEGYFKALDFEPNNPDTLNNLGTVLREQGQWDEAVERYRQAIGFKPDYADAHYNLGNTLKMQGLLEGAVTAFRDAIRLMPGSAKAHNNLGNVLRHQGQLDAAVASYKAALDIQPEYAQALSNLGNVLNDLGRREESIECYEQAIRINPDFAAVHSNLLMSSQYKPGVTAEDILRLHGDWDKRFGGELRGDWRPHDNTRDPKKRIRIGFVSPDLGQHPVGFFLVQLLENRLPDEMACICFSDRIPDSFTERLQAASDGWVDIRGMADEIVADQIRKEQIDILFDLSGHMARNRLLTFARKPAPVQVTWLGYVGTTGLGAMDYLLSDRYYTPPGEDRMYSEKIIRMPDAFFCYEPSSFAPDVGSLPADRNGFVTFGSFNNPTKFNDDVMAAWAKILKAVPDSRMVLKYRGVDDPANRECFEARFEAEGVDASRLVFEGGSDHSELLARYNEIDIALDSFPYSGSTTTCEALWMGVPVITVPGKTFAGRHSLSNLSTIGLSELVARDVSDYIDLAVALAHDRPRLSGFRAGLRQRMEKSALCNGPKFAQNFASAMRDIWRQWCESEAGP